MDWRGFLPKWAWRFFQMAGYLFGFVAVIFTVLTIPEDFKATVLGTMLGDGVPWFVLLIAAGVFLSIAQVGRMAIARAVTSDGPALPKGESEMGSKVVVREGVMELADPEKAEIKPDESQERIEELQAEVEGLRAWKDRTSDWEDKIDRLERVESTHAGCGDHRDVLQARVTELEAENEGLQSIVVHQSPDRGLIFTDTRVSHESSGRSGDLTSVVLTWHLTNAGLFRVCSSQTLSGVVKMNDVPLVTPPSLSRDFPLCQRT